MEKNKKMIIGIIGVLIVVLVFNVYFIYQMLKPVKNDNEKEETNTDNRQYTLNLKYDSYGNICDTESCGEDYNET